MLLTEMPSDFPSRWPAIAERLNRPEEPDQELGVLLESVGLQRYTGPGHEERYGPERRLGQALGTIDRPTTARLTMEPVPEAT